MQGGAGGANCITSARTWSKMGSSTLSKMRVQKGRVKAEPWNLRVSNSTSKALYLMSGLGSNVSSDRPASKGNQKYMCSSLSLNCRPCNRGTGQPL